MNGDHLMGGVVGAAGAFVSGIALWVVQGFARGREEKVEEAKKRLDTHEAATAAAFKEMAAANATAIKELTAHLHQSNILAAKLEGRIESLHTTLSGYSQGVSELKGRVDDAVNQQSSHIATLAHMSKQIDALFTIVEAGKRASDQAKEELSGRKG